MQEEELARACFSTSAAYAWRFNFGFNCIERVGIW